MHMVNQDVEHRESQRVSVQNPVVNTRMHKILERFEAEFLVPLEKESKEKLLAASRERNAQSLQW